MVNAKIILGTLLHELERWLVVSFAAQGGFGASTIGCHCLLPRNPMKHEGTTKAQVMTYLRVRPSWTQEGLGFSSEKNAVNVGGFQTDL